MALPSYDGHPHATYELLLLELLLELELYQVLPKGDSSYLHEYEVISMEEVVLVQLSTQQNVRRYDEEEEAALQRYGAGVAKPMGLAFASACEHV